MSSSAPIRLTTPLTREKARELRAGQAVYLTGKMYAARDNAHKRLVELLRKGEKTPIDLHEALIYYVGPSPTRPGEVIGSAGPTTSGRMDPYMEDLLKAGMTGCIGKGSRSPKVVELLQQYGGVYFTAVGGAAALISAAIKAVQVIAYEELGAEAIRELTVEEFPCIVANDTMGNDAFQIEQAKYRRL